MDLHGVYGLLLTLIYTGQHVCSAGYTHGDRHELKSSSLTRARDRELGRAARTLLHPILSRKRRALANSEMHTLLHLHNSYRKLEGAADMELLVSVGFHNSFCCLTKHRCISGSFMKTMHSCVRSSFIIA